MLPLHKDQHLPSMSTQGQASQMLTPHRQITLSRKLSKYLLFDARRCLNCDCCGESTFLTIVSSINAFAFAAAVRPLRLYTCSPKSANFSRSASNPRHIHRITRQDRVYPDIRPRQKNKRLTPHGVASEDERATPYTSFSGTEVPARAIMSSAAGAMKSHGKCNAGLWAVLLQMSKAGTGVLDLDYSRATSGSISGSLIVES